ncbi:nuclear transport factor 2 family protein [Sporosarcina sp. CAU 1771]
MKKVASLLAVLTVLFLSACSSDKGETIHQGTVDDGEVSTGYGAIDHGVDENKVGFNITGDTIEEATNIPEAEKQSLLQVFELYISAFNEKDVDQYIDLLSAHSESFDKEEERTYMTDNVFSVYDLDRQATDIVIVSYNEKEAQVFSKLKTSMKQLATGLEVVESGRQVTVFVKEEDNWKVSSVYYIGESGNK